MFDQLGPKLFNTSVSNKNQIKFEYLAFLKQSNVIKHIDFDYATKDIRVIFAFCDQDIQHQGRLTLLGHVFTFNQLVG